MKWLIILAPPLFAYPFEAIAILILWQFSNPLEQLFE